ncbi:MAG: hypothetical protein II937_00980 [Bacteroidales bacterium]|nr:hypothetical protein [Bacteroidales bacterium]
MWKLLKLCSAETLYDVWRERYDRVIEWLEGVRDGKNTPDLPLKGSGSSDGESSGNIFHYGSNKKFNHYL